MVVHYPRERLRFNSQRPTAVRNVLVEGSPGSYRTGDLPLGVPTASARSGRGLWALYPAGDQVVVVHPGGAVAGPRVEVAAALDGLIAANGQDPLDREAVRAMRALLAGDGATVRPLVRRWSRPAVGYWISGPDNAQRRHQRPAQAAQPPGSIAIAAGERAHPVEPTAPAEPLRPAA